MDDVQLPAFDLGVGRHFIEMFGDVDGLFLEALMVFENEAAILENLVQMEVCIVREPEILGVVGKRLDEIAQQQVADGFVLQFQRLLREHQRVFVGGVPHLMDRKPFQVFYI
jgi:hypothetical protein